MQTSPIDVASSFTPLRAGLAISPYHRPSYIPTSSGEMDEPHVPESTSVERLLLRLRGSISNSLLSDDRTSGSLRNLVRLLNDIERLRREEGEGLDEDSSITDRLLDSLKPNHRGKSPTSAIDDLSHHTRGDSEADSGGSLALKKRRTRLDYLGQLMVRRDPADSHPVYLGYGQQAAESAMDTLAQIIAEDGEKMKNKETVRFIGKRAH